MCSDDCAPPVPSTTMTAREGDEGVEKGKAKEAETTANLNERSEKEEKKQKERNSSALEYSHDIKVRFRFKKLRQKDYASERLYLLQSIKRCARLFWPMFKCGFFSIC